VTVNDSFFSVLSAYDGSVDDRKKKYLVATESYSDSLSVQDMERTKLTALGYIGSLNDMWSQYLISLGGTGLDSMSALLSSTFYGTTLSLSFLLLETGDTVLLESSDKIVLE
jgi:hypothetical protein